MIKTTETNALVLSVPSPDRGALCSSARGL